MKNIVHLNWNEMFISAQAGLLRRLETLQQSSPLCPNTVISGWDSDLSGAIAEYAFAKRANMFWEPTVNTWNTRPDIGENIQIRSTRHPNGHLLVRKIDKETDAFVLVRGAFEQWEIVGWILGRYAKQEKFWRNDEKDPWKSCFWVPDSELLPIETLIGEKVQ